jgi:hypothetical protein
MGTQTAAAEEITGKLSAEIAERVAPAGIHIIGQ